VHRPDLDCRSVANWGVSPRVLLSTGHSTALAAKFPPSIVLQAEQRKASTTGCMGKSVVYVPS
jgi:hypothetical protein